MLGEGNVYLTAHSCVVFPAGLTNSGVKARRRDDYSALDTKLQKVHSLQ